MVESPQIPVAIAAGSARHPSKSSLAARARNFPQVSGLPVVLIESDRERMDGEKSHVKSFGITAESIDAFFNNASPDRVAGAVTLLPATPGSHTWHQMGS